MALFNKTDQRADYSSNITTIAAGTHFTGKIDIECELHIDGEVDAEINSTGLIKIGLSGVVNSSNLRASKLIVSGKFLGEADCEAVEIIDGGDVQGKLTSATLEIVANGAFQGESIRKDSNDYSKTKGFGDKADTGKADTGKADTGKAGGYKSKSTLFTDKSDKNMD